MENKVDNPYSALERIFHEPIRMAIMSALLGSPEGLSFNELRDLCETSDGNLSRHLKALEEAGAVHIKKSFVRKRPRTTVKMTSAGQGRFAQYLDALEAVLQEAAARIAEVEKAARRKKAPGGGELAKA